MTGLVVSSVSLFSITGCGDDDDDDDDGSDAGRGGTSASGGSGGNRPAGSGGTAGGGRGGTAGTAGTSGTPGMGGATAGEGGQAGGGTGGIDGEAGGGVGGTDGGQAGGGTGGDGGQAGGGGAPATCEDYCDVVLTSCTATADRQYPDPAASTPNAAQLARTQCLRTCEAFPETNEENSFACRYDEALLADTDVSHCDMAGPAGLLACGGACAGYCNLMLTYCANEAEGASMAACMQECLTVPERAFSNYVYPAPAGDTLHCRLAHASNAAAADAGSAARMLHCDHAAGDAPPCLDTTPTLP